MSDIAVRTFLIGLMLYMFWFGMPYSIFHYFTMQARPCLLLSGAYETFVARSCNSLLVPCTK